MQSLRDQKEKLEKKIEKEKILIGQLPELSLNLNILELVKLRVRITIGEIALLTNANRNTIKKQLKEVIEANHLKMNGLGKGSRHLYKKKIISIARPATFSNHYTIHHTNQYWSVQIFPMV